jgi:hypothetical protein
MPNVAAPCRIAGRREEPVSYARFVINQMQQILTRH